MTWRETAGHAGERLNRLSAFSPFILCFSLPRWFVPLFFFFNDTATTEIYTLSLHDALPISALGNRKWFNLEKASMISISIKMRSEEHTSELQSPLNLVCRLLLEKKKKK